MAGVVTTITPRPARRCDGTGRLFPNVNSPVVTPGTPDHRESYTRTGVIATNAPADAGDANNRHFPGEPLCTHNHTSPPVVAKNDPAAWKYVGMFARTPVSRSASVCSDLATMATPDVVRASIAACESDAAYMPVPSSDVPCTPTPLGEYPTTPHAAVSPATAPIPPSSSPRRLRSARVYAPDGPAD